MRTRVSDCVLFVLLLFFSGCKNGGELKGEVFVVTKGRDNIKLALVEVRALPEEEIRSYLEKKQTEIQGIEAGLNRKLAYGPKMAMYFDHLPSGIATATTNADGRFSIKLPSKGRFALAARSSRKLVASEEEYYWLVWISLDGAASKEVVLSNNNLATAFPAESLLNDALLRDATR